MKQSQCVNSGVTYMDLFYWKNPHKNTNKKIQLFLVIEWSFNWSLHPNYPVSILGFFFNIFAPALYSDITTTKEEKR